MAVQRVGSPRPGNRNADGVVTAADLYPVHATPVDLDGDGTASGTDKVMLERLIRRYDADAMEALRP